VSPGTGGSDRRPRMRCQRVALSKEVARGEGKAPVPMCFHSRGSRTAPVTRLCTFQCLLNGWDWGLSLEDATRLPQNFFSIQKYN
jgi:hypothetical protein